MDKAAVRELCELARKRIKLAEYCGVGSAHFMPNAQQRAAEKLLIISKRLVYVLEKLNTGKIGKLL